MSGRPVLAYDRCVNAPLARKHMNLTAKWLYSSGAIHAGYDYGVDIGTPVFAVRNGRILKVVDNIQNMAADQAGQSGDPPNFIIQGFTYNKEPACIVYLHISPNVPVSEGDEVSAGQQIALSGHNGHSTGPHLHISTMKGHHFGPFDYLDNLADNSSAPNGLAPNGISIYPPSKVFPRQAVHELARPAGIVLEEMKFGTKNSDTVRRLQHRLNGIPLVGGAELPVTGNYLDMTRAEVQKWQIQKRKAKEGTEMADGNLHPKQARIMFGKRFTFVHAK
jgi:hypothetical protein